MAQTQGERRSETRRRLLEAARAVVSDRGVAGASVDAMAEAAERTSGALYDHFGDKDGLILALADYWKEATVAGTEADLAATEDPEERLGLIWRNFAVAPAEGGEQWTLLEHELWLHACRQPGLRSAVADRYTEIRRALADALGAGLLEERGGDGTTDGRDTAVATLMIGLMVGLEMQRRIDPSAVDDQLAVDGLAALAALG